MKMITKVTLTSALLLGLSNTFAQKWVDVYFNPYSEKVVQESFVDAGTIKGAAVKARLAQDEMQAACSNPARAFKGAAGAKFFADIMKSQLDTVVYPEDGNYLGDWKKGEKVAQSGKGHTWRDKPGRIAGGSCYNCHQGAAKELSYGNIGPSLYNYGKTKGYSKAAVKKTWAQLYNAKAFNACSHMPRFGHKNILTLVQMKDIMAYLYDPQSDLNK